MLLRQIFDPYLAQYAYLVGCQRSGEALIIDPQRDIDRYKFLAQENGLRITAVAETHIHADFVSGAEEFVVDPDIHLYLYRVKADLIGIISGPSQGRTPVSSRRATARETGLLEGTPGTASLSLIAPPASTTKTRLVFFCYSRMDSARARLATSRTFWLAHRRRPSRRHGAISVIPSTKMVIDSGRQHPS